jgi:hypothetical protein
VRGALPAAFIAALIFTCAVPLGIADTQRGTDPSGDVEGGAGSSADIVRTTAGTDSRGRIVQTVSVAGNAGGTPTYLYIELPDQSNAVAECTVVVGVFRGRPGVYRCGTNERLGSATVKRTSSRTLRFTFSKRALGNPRSYEWAAVTRSDANANGSWTRHDRLPSGDDEYLSYSLR